MIRSAQGNGIVGNNDPIAPVFTQYYDDTIATQEYDPAMACDLLTQAGKNPLDIDALLSAGHARL